MSHSSPVGDGGIHKLPQLGVACDPAESDFHGILWPEIDKMECNLINFWTVDALSLIHI